MFKQEALILPPPTGLIVERIYRFVVMRLETRKVREARCNQNSTFNENRFTCVYYALTDTNYFKNL